MQNNSDKTFWSLEDESDEDFETIINAANKDEEVVEIQPKSKILSSEKMDFLWSDEEEEAFIDDNNNLQDDNNNLQDDNNNLQDDNNNLQDDNNNLQDDNNNLEFENKKILQDEENQGWSINEKDENQGWSINEEEENQGWSINEEEGNKDQIYDQELKFKRDSCNDRESLVLNENGPPKNIKGNVDEEGDQIINEEGNQKINEEGNQKINEEGIQKTNEDDNQKIIEDDKDNFANDNPVNKSEVNDFELEVSDTNEDEEFFDRIRHQEEIIIENQLKTKQNSDINQDKQEEELIENLEDYYVENIQDAEMVEESKNLSSIFNPSLFDAKDSEDSDFLEHNTLINEIENGIKNINLENSVQNETIEHLVQGEIKEEDKLIIEKNIENYDPKCSENKKAEKYSEDKFEEKGLEEEKINLPNNTNFENETADFLNEDNDEDDSTFFYNAIKNEIKKYENNPNVINEPENTNNPKITEELNSEKTVVDNEPTLHIEEEITKQPKALKVETKYKIPVPQINKTNENSSKTNYQKHSFNLADPKPITCLFKGKVLTYYSSIQKRYTKQGTTKDQLVNIVNIYKLQNPFLLTKMCLPSAYENQSLQCILNILKLKDIHADSVAEVIGAKSVKYATKSFSDSENVSDINTALNMANLNSKMAVDFALSKNMWTTALIISKMNQDVLDRVLSEMIDKDMKPLFSTGEFIMKKHWKEYFMHFANTQKSASHEKYIFDVFKGSQEDGFLVLIALHLCKVIDLGDYIQYFSHKNQLLDLLFYIHKNLLKIKNLDLLMYEYICDIKDRNIEFVKDFYKTNKKEFRKDLQSKLDELFKLNWNFGIKDVLNFGIAKILDVQEPEKKTDNKLAITKNPLISKKVYSNIKFMKDPEKLTEEETKMNANVEELKSNVVEVNSNIVKTAMTEKIAKSNVEISAKKSREIYADQKHSKSFADFFDSDKQEKEVTTEDDTSLFLSKYNMEDEDDKIGIKKDSPTSDTEEKGSFFGIFNMFKKKSYKIDVKASDDIKYDPVTKRWVTGDQKEAPKEAPVNISKIPTPQMKNSDLSDKTGIPVSKKNVDLKKMSLYAGKKKTNVGGFSTLKKDVK